MLCFVTYSVEAVKSDRKSEHFMEVAKGAEKKEHALIEPRISLGTACSSDIPVHKSDCSSPKRVVDTDGAGEWVGEVPLKCAVCLEPTLTASLHLGWK